MKKPIFALIIAAGALVLPALPAVAVSIPQSIPGFESDGMLLFNTNHSLFDALGATEAYESSHPNFLFSFTTTGPADAIGFGSPGFISERGEITDVFGVANIGTAANPKYVLAFMSDDNLDIDIAEGFFGDLFSKTGHLNWIPRGVETGGSLSITEYIDQTKCPGCTGTFQSDLNVPDGGMTITLLGTALAGSEFCAGYCAPLNRTSAH